MTKAVVAATAAKLVDMGKLQWDAKASDYITELKGKKWKLANEETEVREPTIAELCSHTSGAWYKFLEADESKHSAYESQLELLTQTKSWAQFVHKVGLLFEPGTKFLYGHGIDVVGDIISKIEGRTLGEVMKEYIFDPLEMKNTGFTLPESKREGASEIWTSEAVGKDFKGDKGFGNIEAINQFLWNLDGAPPVMAQTAYFDSYTQAGGHGLWGTLGDYSKFIGMIANLGTGLNGAKIFEPSSALKFIFPIVHDVLVKFPGLIGEAHDLRYSKFAAFDSHNLIAHWVGIASTQFIIDFKNHQYFIFVSQSWSFPSWMTLYDLYVKHTGGVVHPGIIGKTEATTKEEL